MLEYLVRVKGTTNLADWIPQVSRGCETRHYCHSLSKDPCLVTRYTGGWIPYRFIFPEPVSMIFPISRKTNDIFVMLSNRDQYRIYNGPQDPYFARTSFQLTLRNGEFVAGT